jgi:hypothetical protein
VHAIQPFDLRGADQPFGRQEGFASAVARQPLQGIVALARRDEFERRVRAHRFEHLVQRTRRHGGLCAQ